MVLTCATRASMENNEALNDDIDIHEWQCEHIREGLREADASKFASDAEVNRVLTRLGQKPDRTK